MKKRYLRNKDDMAKELTPEQFADYLGATKIDDIRVLGFNAYINREAMADSEDPSMDVSDTYEIEHDEELCVATADITLTFKSEKEKEPVLKISVTYEIEITTEEKLPDEFWELYQTITLPSIIWPYFREFVQSTTNRMNIPAFVLPV